jgi:hypothetical protein
LPSTHDVLLLGRLFFAKLEIVKPASSSRLNDELYAIFTGRKQRSMKVESVPNLLKKDSVLGFSNSQRKTVKDVTSAYAGLHVSILKGLENTKTGADIMALRGFVVTKP